MNDDESSAWLRHRLRAADPARHLTHTPPLELTEALMSTSPTPARPNRTRLALVAAAAAVLVMAGVGVIVGLGNDDEPTTTASPKPTGTTSPEAPATPTYSLDPAAQSARCMPPNAERLRAFDAAVRGVVASADGKRVLVNVRHDYRQPGAHPNAQARKRVVALTIKGSHPEMLPVRFEVGKEYVIGVKAGVVQLCGATQAVTPALDQAYRTAFPTR